MEISTNFLFQNKIYGENKRPDNFTNILRSFYVIHYRRTFHANFAKISLKGVTQ